MHPVSKVATKSTKTGTFARNRGFSFMTLTVIWLIGLLSSKFRFLDKVRAFFLSMSTFEISQMLSAACKH